MNKPNVKELVIKIYSNLIEENLQSLLKAEDTLKKTNMTPKESLDLREKIKGVSQEISIKFADIVIAKGFPDKEITHDEVKNIIKKLIEEKISTFKDGKNKN